MFTLVAGFSVLCVVVILLMGILLAADKKEQKICTSQACISAGKLTSADFYFKPNLIIRMFSFIFTSTNFCLKSKSHIEQH